MKKRDNLPLVIALVLFGLMVAVTLLAVDVAIGQGTNLVQNGTFDGLDGWTPNNPEWVTYSPDYDYAGDDGSAQFVTPGGAITQSVTLSPANLYYMFLYANADDPDCRVLHCLGGTCYNSPLNHTGWSQLGLAGVYEAGDYVVSIQWWPTSTCTSTALYVDDVQVYGEPDSTPTPAPTDTPTPTPTSVPGSQPELLTQNPFFEEGLDYWTNNQYVTLCDTGDPDAPCVRLRLFGEIRQTFESPGYGTLYVAADARQTTCPANTVYIQLCLESEQYGRMCQAWPLPYGDGQEFVAQYDHMPGGEYTMYARYYGVGCVNGEIILQAAAAFWEAGSEPQETATPWPTTTRLVPPSPTPRALLATPMGASNLDAIIDEGTLTIGWVGPALLGILIAAFGWAGRVFEWLGTLATWLFSGEWRGGGEV